MFGAQKRLYFVFSDNNDTYCLKSMLRLKLREYLYLSVNKCGYSSVFFLTGKSDNSIEITVFDAESYEKNKTDDSFLAHKLWNTGAKPISFPQTLYNGPASPRTKKWLITRLHEENTAIIADLSAFHTLWQSADKDEKYNLINALQFEKAGTLIINAPTELKRDVLTLFSDKDGIIEYKTASNGKYLIPDAGTIDRSTTPYILDEIRKRMPGEWLELTSISFDELGVIIDSAFFEKGEILDDSRRLDLINFFYYWLYSPEFRRDTKGSSDLFSKVSGRVTRNELLKFLSGNCEAAVNERIAAQRRQFEATYKVSADKKPLFEILHRHYGPRDMLTQRAISYVKLDCPILSRLEGIEMPAIAETGHGAPGFNILRTKRSDWDAMRMNVRKPLGEYPSDLHLGWISKFCDALEQAASFKDTDTVNRALNVLMYCGKSLMTAAEDFDAYCKGCDVYLKASKDFFMLANELKRAESNPDNQLAEAHTKVAAVHYSTYHEALNRYDKLLINTMPSLSVDIKNITSTLNTLNDKLSRQIAESSTVDAPDNENEKAEAAMEGKPFAPPPSEPTIDRLVQDMSTDEALEILMNEN